MPDTHLRAIAGFVGTTVCSGADPCYDNEHKCAQHLQHMVASRLALTLSEPSSLALLRLRPSALDPEVRTVIEPLQDELLEIIMIARQGRVCVQERKRMATRNTIEDLVFAQMYLEFVAKRSMSPEVRARASIVLALIRMLDAKHPGWKEEVLKELSANSVTKNVCKMFELPQLETDSLFDKFIKQIAKE